LSDIELVHAEGRDAAAGRLREALANEGHAAEGRAVPDSDEPPALGDAAALLILWDRSTMAHGGLRQVAAAARRRGRAIDVSMDGITPLGIEDESELVILSGWRGEPGHPGWRKILARLERLSPQVRQAAAPRAAAPAPTSARGSTGRRNVLLGTAAALVLALGAGGALLMSGRVGSGRPEAAAPPAVAAPHVARPSAVPAGPPAAGAVAAPQQGPAPALGGGAGAGGPGLAPSPAAPAAPAPPINANASPCPGPGGAAAGCQPTATAGTSPHASRKARRHEPARPAIRYTKYSTTMRLFCQRSGRGTPECRIFSRAHRR
jgi:hypothetical protein